MSGRMAASAVAGAVEAAVLAAFRTARSAGRPSVECYRAGVEAWRRAFPEQTREYAAKRAVAVILAAHARLRVEE
jgi:pilus assembly protein TadC